MNRADFRKELQLGLNAVFGMAYARYPDEWKKLFAVENSFKAYEEDVMLAGFGGAEVKGEGAPVGYDEGGEAYASRYVHETIALAFRITEEAEEDGLYGSIGSRYSKALARAMQHTKEIKGADVFNNAFDSNVTGGDGKPLLATDHPLWGGGTFSNKLSTPADLDETSLEEVLNLIEEFVDERGIPTAAQALKLAVATDNQWNAGRILGSAYRPGTADNDINVINDTGAVREGYCVNHRFTDPDAWFLTTDVEDGLKHFRRIRLQRGLEGDFETGNLRYKARERYSFGWSDPRCLAGSEGSGS